MNVDKGIDVSTDAANMYINQNLRTVSASYFKLFRIRLLFNTLEIKRDIIIKIRVAIPAKAVASPPGPITIIYVNPKDNHGMKKTNRVMSKGMDED